MAADFLAYFCKVNHKKSLEFTKEVEEAISNHAWPGNVRELRNAIERAVILGGSEKISIMDLPGNITPIANTPSIGDKISLSIIEEMHIRRILAVTSSLQEASDILGIDQATLWRKRKIYGI